MTNDTLPGQDSGGIAPATSVTDAEIRDFAACIGLTHAAPDRCSRLLMFELYVRSFYPVPVPIHPAKVVAEVRAMEGIGRPQGTKPATQFKHPPLQGLWKKHYLMGGLQSVAANIQLGFGRKEKNLRRAIEQNWNPATAHLPPEMVSQNIANATVKLYAERSCEQGLTGEWIIYTQHGGQNYYLCLALHNEGDANVFDRIAKGCVYDFPFLRSQLRI
jgi:hypothetical protein